MRAVQIEIFLPEIIFRLRIWLVLRYRKLRYGYAFRKIPLTQGKYAIVDPEDYEQLARYKWYAMRNGREYYAVRNVPAGKDRRKDLRMHQVIMGTAEGKFIDHTNHNGLDNRKANLRTVTKQQNNWNRRKKRGNNSSRYKGVNWIKSVGKWRARIQYNDREISIGYFDNEKAAAMAYDAKAKELFGDYAAPNLPSSSRRWKTEDG